MAVLRHGIRVPDIQEGSPLLTLQKFTGINNVLPPERMSVSALASAPNVDIGLSGELLRRAGYELLSPDCHRNLHQAKGYLLATLSTGELAAINDGVTTVVHPAMGPDRVWYTDLPGGRTLFSNGLISGVTDGATSVAHGVPVPETVGAPTSVLGALDPGTYQWGATYVRLADGQESGLTFGGAVDLAEGGILLTGLPARAGHSLNVYMTGANGDAFFFAGSAPGSAFSFLGKNDELSLPCRTQHMTPMPVGTLCAYWRGRTLVAAGTQLAASCPHQWGLHDPRRDFKQFSSPITLIQPVDDGIYVGSETELAFLAGDEFDKLVFRQVLPGRVTLGSGVSVPGELIRRGEGVGADSAMVCIADGKIVAGFSSGAVDLMTGGRYHVPTTITEVFATFREKRGIPQYLATPA
jgi:hypothetical protein